MRPVIKTSQQPRKPINSRCRRFSTTLDKVLNLEVCMHFCRPQTKFREGNAFTGVCQSIHTGGRAVVSFHHTHLLLYPPGTVPPRSYPQRPYPQDCNPWGPYPRDHTYPTRNHKSGRYASYWNAALLSIESTGDPPRKKTT